MKTLREILIFLFASMVFVYVVSIFTFTPHHPSLIYEPSFNGTSLMGGFGAFIASFSFFLVGKASYFFTLPLFGLVLSLIFQKKQWIKPLAWSFLLIIILSGFYGLFSSPNLIIRGGLVGNIMGNFFKNLFGYIGTTLVLFALHLIVLSKIAPLWSQKIVDKVLKKPSLMPKKALPSPKVENFDFNQNQQNIINEETQRAKNEEQQQQFSYRQFLAEENQKYEIKEIKKTEDFQEKLNNEDFYDFNEVEEPQHYLENKEEENYVIKSKEILLNQEENPNYFDASKAKPVKTIENSLPNQDLIKKEKVEEITKEPTLSSFHSYSHIITPSNLEDIVKENTFETPSLIEESKEETEEYDNNQDFITKDVLEEEFPLKESDLNLPKKEESSKSYPNPPYHNFHFPPLEILKHGDKQTTEDYEKIEQTGYKLLSVLKEFNIEARISNMITGPVVTRYEIIPPKGLRVNKISALSDNIALGIAAYDKIRMEAPIPGKPAIGIEVPNHQRQIVTLRDLIENSSFKPKKMALPFALGTGISGKPFYTDISKIPHLLIAGSTGSGKSVCVNSLICSILYTKRPDEVKMILIDPKRVELKMYDDLPHLVTPVIKEPSQAILALNWAVNYMEERYKTLEQYNVRHILNYNDLREQEKKPPLPYLVIVIDEFADLMMMGKKEIEDPIIRLAAMARAVGIHLVLATQRPSADVITGLIKANFPGRIAFKVTNKMESRIIMDVNGADSLLGKGDMLYASPSMPAMKRIQSPFISDDEVYEITQFFKKRYKPNYWDEILEEEEITSELDPLDPSEEPLFNDAVEIILKEQKASASYLQRRMKIGYNRAARIVEMMEEMGIVGPGAGAKPREVLIDSW